MAMSITLSLMSMVASGAEPAEKVTAAIIREYLISNSPWVKPDKTVDIVKFGDPDKPVKKAAVCWYASIETLRKAAAEGCDLVITHEPTFWEHAAPELAWRGKEPGKAKVEFLKEAGLTVLRAHDTWDQWPECGIRDSWAQFLELGKLVYESEGTRYYGVYEVPEQDLRAFAQYVADKIKPLGEDSAQVIGDPGRKVRRAAIGVGCVTPDEEHIKAGADVIICCYDGASYWSTRERLHESGAAVITLEHGSTEIPGMMVLAKHLAAKYPGVEFIHIAEHARTWTVKGK